jgi:hypothetical protein
MRYYLPFQGAIPHLTVDCSRVTHPSATEQYVLLHIIPFDLHVLTTPPAFILSQDQTLQKESPIILVILELLLPMDEPSARLYISLIGGPNQSHKVNFKELVSFPLTSLTAPLGAACSVSGGKAAHQEPFLFGRQTLF